MWSLFVAIVVLLFDANLAIVDHRATSETNHLYNSLKSIAKDPNKILFGMQEATWLGAGGGHAPYVVEPNNGAGNTSGWIYQGSQARSGYKDELCDVKQMTGQYPAVIGFDIADTSNDHLLILRTLMKYAYDRGMAITLTNHWNNPLTGFKAWIQDDHGDTLHVLQRLLPGGDHNAKFRSILDHVADAAHTFKGSDGKLIPVIYRPFHENNGGWFWWGQNNKAHNTAEDFKKVFQYLVHYLRDIKGVHNFLYAYSPNAGYTDFHTGVNWATSYLATYPGDEYVDVFGVDDYYTVADPNKRQFYVDRMSELVTEAEKRGKIPALTEVGYQNNGIDSHHDFFLDRVLNPLKGTGVTARPAARRIAYILTWGNHCYSNGHCELFAPYHGHPAEHNFLNFYNDPVTVFENGLHNLYTQ